MTSISEDYKTDDSAQSILLLPFSSARWQATKCLGCISRNSGSTFMHSSTVKGQRVWNTQPEGGFAGLGGSPLRMKRLRCLSNLGRGMGTAEMSDCV